MVSVFTLPDVNTWEVSWEVTWEEISCSPNLPRVYIRLCKHGNHFTFLHCNSTRGELTIKSWELKG